MPKRIKTGFVGNLHNDGIAPGWAISGNGYTFAPVTADAIVLVKQFLPGGTHRWALGRVLGQRRRGVYFVHTRYGDYGYHRSQIRVLTSMQLEGLDLSGL